MGRGHGSTRAGGASSGGGGARKDSFYTFSLGNGQTVTISKNKTPAQVVKQANRLAKQLGQRIQGMEGFNNITNFSELMAFNSAANKAKGKSAQRIQNALHIARSLTKGSRGGKMGR